MPRYEVMVQQRVVHIFTKVFVAKSAEKAQELAEADLEDGVDESTWVESRDSASCDGETITDVSLVKKAKKEKA